MYYLYLIEIGSIDEQDYLPQIIQNPAVNVMDAEEWFVEAQSYFVKRV